MNPDPLNIPERLTRAGYSRLTQLSLEHEARYCFAAQFAPGRRVLDVGCGEGIFLGLARDTGATELFGLDRSPEAVAAARERLGENVHLQQGMAETLPYADRSFDLVCAMEVIEHLEEPGAAVAEFRRVVRPDGHVIISVPNDELLPGSNPHHRVKFSQGRFMGLLRQHFPHVRLFRLVTYAGATVLPVGHEEMSVRLPDLEHRGWTAVASMRKLGAGIQNTSALGPLSRFEVESTSGYRQVIHQLTQEVAGLKAGLRDLRQSVLYRLLHQMARGASRLDLAVPEWLLPEGFRRRPGDTPGPDGAPGRTESR